MSEKPLVSIVLPVYNGEKYLASAIGSILAQTYNNWELILVNDCSTDGSGEIMEAFAARDGRIRVIHNKGNLKLPCSLNVGFSQAEGDYYTWTSDDNLLRPEMLATMVEAMEKDTSLGMVYSNYAEINETGEKTGFREVGQPEDLFGENCIGASFLYRADIAEKIGGYDADLFLAEDYDYWMRIFIEAPIKKIPADLYAYRRHSESLTETKKESVRHQAFLAVEKNYEALLKQVEKDKERFHLKEHFLSLADGTEYKKLLAEYKKQDKAFIRWRNRTHFRQKLGRLKAWLLGKRRGWQQNGLHNVSAGKRQER